MDKLQKNLDTLKILSCCNKKTKTDILQKSDSDLIHCLEECVLNTLNGNIKLSDKEIKKLKKFKYSLRKILDKKKSSDKKKIFIQEGGFLQYILPGAIALITSLIEKYLIKK